jgi:hypothetical protein
LSALFERAPPQVAQEFNRGCIRSVSDLPEAPPREILSRERGKNLRGLLR